jgi:hypothetical protein
MAHVPRFLAVLKDAIGVVLRRLAALPPSPRVEELRAKAEGYLRSTEGWVVSPPDADERDKVMKDVLMLHVEVGKLERAKPGAMP